MSKISIIRWDDYNMSISFTNKDKTAVDLTGCTLFFTVKEKTKLKEDSDDIFLIKKDITQHIDPEAGKTALILTNTETDIETGTFVYDFQIRTVWGELHSTVRWEFVVVEDVTKRKI